MKATNQSQKSTIDELKKQLNIIYIAFSIKKKLKRPNLTAQSRMPGRKPRVLSRSEV